MSSRSLLFSSDQETSRVVGQVLRAFGLDVEHCSEIFVAVERLTSRHFEVVIADLDDGVEAHFLLKTSRELTSSHDSLVIALASTGINASQPKVDVVLSKPLVADKLRWTLLKNEAFLAAIKKSGSEIAKSGIEKSDAAINAVNKSGHKLAKPGSPLPKFVSELSKSGPDPQFDFPKPASAFDLQEIEEPLFEAAPIIPLAETATQVFQHEATSVYPSTILSMRDSGKAEIFEPRQPRLRAKKPATPLALVRQSMLGVFFLGLAYVGVQPARSEAIVSSVAVVYQKAVDGTNSWLHSPSRHDDNADDLDATDLAPSFQPGPLRTIRVEPPAVSLTPEAIASALGKISSLSNTPANFRQQPVGPEIPESIRSGYGDSGLHVAAEKPENVSSASLLGSVEPVALPEDISQKMVVDRVQPSYPKQAIEAGLQGPVVLQAWISREGNVEDLKLIRGYLVLGQAASAAVRQWHYKPYVLNGRAIAAQTLVTIDFRLPQMVSISVPDHQ